MPVHDDQIDHLAATPHGVDSHHIPATGAVMPPTPTTIDLTHEDNEAQIAVRHPDGQVLILTLKAHRSTVSLYVPGPVQMKGTDDPNEMMLSWMMVPEERGGVVKH